MEPDSLLPLAAIIIHSHLCSFSNIQSFCPSKTLPVKDETSNVVVQGLKFIMVSAVVSVLAFRPLDS